MARKLARPPLGRIALWGFLLNIIWEFVQCVVFYDMWRRGFWRATAWMWGAILGDVVIVLGVTMLACFAVGARHVSPPDRIGLTAMLGFGFAASIVLEWAAKILHLWAYSDLMPVVEIAGYEVGLSPIAQVTFLPAASVYLACIYSKRTNDGQCV
jgi:hypothetical protein